MSLAVALMIGRVHPSGSADVPSRSAARNRFSVLLKKTIGLGNLQYGEAHGVRASPALHGHVLYIQGSRVHDMVRSPPQRSFSVSKCQSIEMLGAGVVAPGTHAYHSACSDLFVCLYLLARHSHVLSFLC
jgi:hypothetical protein